MLKDNFIAKARYDAYKIKVDRESGKKRICSESYKANELRSL